MDERRDDSIISDDGVTNELLSHRAGRRRRRDPPPLLGGACPFGEPNALARRSWSCCVSVEALAHEAAESWRRVPDGGREQAGRAALPDPPLRSQLRVDELALHGAPVALEGPEPLVVTVRAPEVELVQPLVASLADRRPEERMVGSHPPGGGVR